MVNSMASANALATVVGVGYILCRLIAVVAPDLLFKVGQSWFHTVDFRPLRTTGSMPTGMCFLGLVSSVVASWAAAFATVALYRRWTE